jgi:hypothetical protein
LTIRTAKISFIGGEVSPIVNSEIESEKYFTGMAKIENYMVDFLGGIKNSPATKFITECYNTAELSKSIEFQFNEEQAYVLEFADNIMRIIRNDALVHRDIVDSSVYKWTLSGSGTNEYYLELLAGGNPVLLETAFLLENGIKMTNGTVGSLAAGEYDHGDNDALGFSTFYVRLSDSVDPDTKANGYLQIPVEVVTPYPIADVPLINGDAKAADTIYILHPDYKIRKITRTSHTDWTVTELDEMDGPYKSPEDGDRQITINATWGSPSWTLTASSAIFTDIEDGDQLRLGFPVPGVDTAKHWAIFNVAGITSDTIITANPVSTAEQFGIVYQEIKNWNFYEGINFWDDYSDSSASLTYDKTNLAAILTQGNAGDSARMQQEILTLPQVKHRLEIGVFAMTGTYPSFNFKVGTTSFGDEIYDSGSITTTGTKTLEFIPTAEQIFLSFDMKEEAIVSIRTGQYKWTLSGVGAGQYYLELVAGGDPGLTEPDNVYENTVALVHGTAAGLNLGEWDYDDVDALGYDTIYVKLNPAVDPDSTPLNWVQAGYIPFAGDIVKISSVYPLLFWGREIMLQALPKSKTQRIGDYLLGTPLLAIQNTA